MQSAKTRSLQSERFFLGATKLALLAIALAPLKIEVRQVKQHQLIVYIKEVVGHHAEMLLKLLLEGKELVGNRVERIPDWEPIGAT